jgi:hypothetical protein
LEVALGGVTGEVLHADHFGNVITSIGQLVWSGDELLLEPAFQGARGRIQEAGGKRQEAWDGGQVRFKASEVAVVVGGREITGVHRAYAEAEPGEALALVGSDAHLEIAVREGSAARRLELRPGDAVVLRLR